MSQSHLRVHKPATKLGKDREDNVSKVVMIRILLYFSYSSISFFSSESDGQSQEDAGDNYDFV